MTELERKACPVCACSTSRGGVRETAPPLPSQWARCATCGLLYETPAHLAVPDEVFLADNGVLPDAATFNPAHHKIARVLRGEVKPWVDMCKYIERRFAQHGAVPNRALLIEVGCGAGEALEYLADSHSAQRVVGFEIDRDDVVFLRGRGREAYYHDVSGPPLAELAGRAGVIICNEVMEHVRDPRAFMLGLARYLAPDGIAWVKFARAEHVEQLHAGEWHYWSLTACVMLLEQSGFTVLSTSRGHTFYDAVVRLDDALPAHRAREHNV